MALKTMAKINISVEIVSSSIKSLSSMSQKSRLAILDLLAPHYQNVSVTIVDTVSDLEELVARKPDLVFLGMKFVPANAALGIHDPHKIWVSEYLDNNGITYTGSNQLAYELEQDKSLAKQCVMDAGLQTSPFYVVAQNSTTLDGVANLPYPLFVKPTDRKSGLGIDKNSVVNNYAQLMAKVSALAVDLRADALVETYLPGQEFSVAVLKKLDSEEYLVMPVELAAPVNSNGHRILSEIVKSDDTETVSMVDDDLLRLKINKLALNVFIALGARDYGRIDIRLDQHGTPNFLEANLVPGLSTGYFIRACLMNEGFDKSTVIQHITELGRNRTKIMVSNVIDPVGIFQLLESALVLPSSKNVAISASDIDQITLYKA